MHTNSPICCVCHTLFRLGWGFGRRGRKNDRQVACGTKNDRQDGHSIFFFVDTRILRFNRIRTIYIHNNDFTKHVLGDLRKIEKKIQS